MSVAGIVLAAGSSSRMGHNKLLDSMEGEALVRRVARRAVEAGLSPVLVVVGHDAEKTSEAVAGLPVRIVTCADWARGQGASLAAGVSATLEAPGEVEGAVVLLADMPLVDAGMIRAVVARAGAAGAEVVTASYGGVTAPPTLYARSVLRELLSGAAEGRGRELVRRLGSAVARVELPASALADVDAPRDLERIAAQERVPREEAWPGGDPRDAAVVERAAAWLSEGLRVAVATVTRTWGSSLRPAGSQLAVNAEGDFAGSVSGGCVESAVVQEAMAVLADGKPRHLRYGVSDDRAWSVGLPCGGNVEIAVVRAERSWVEPLAADLAARRPVVLAVDLATGHARLLHADVAGVREALRTDRSGQGSGAEEHLFLRPFQPPARVVLVGAVHIAQALARMAPAVGLDVCVVDPRTAFATPERFPGVPVRGEWPAEALAGLGIDERTAVVTLAHDPRIDDPALVAALRARCFYVGALGSGRSHAARLARLREQGVAEADLARIHGPVGLSIGALSPGEIATSILAQIVETLRAPVS